MSSIYVCRNRKDISCKFLGKRHHSTMSNAFMLVMTSCCNKKDQFTFLSWYVLSFLVLQSHSNDISKCYALEIVFKDHHKNARIIVTRRYKTTTWIFLILRWLNAIFNIKDRNCKPLIYLRRHKKSELVSKFQNDLRDTTNMNYLYNVCIVYLGKHKY